MDIKVTFTAKEHRDAFANRWNLDIPTDSETEIHVPWHLLHHAKADENSALHQVDEGTHDFIVQGDRDTIEAHGTITKELGNGWFVVNSDSGVELSGHVDSIEITDSPVTFMENVISPDSTENAESMPLDPLSEEGQWPRVRAISRYRPLLSEYALHDLKHISTPELYIIDSGVNFDHDEFNYPELETEDFFALDVFNGDFRDNIGHGTAVASMAVGKNLGIAKHAKLVNVKIGGIVNGENIQPSLLDLGEAIDAILERAVADPVKTRVVNISWVVSQSPWLDSKINNLLEAGVTVVAAAGNKGVSVDDVSPAGIKETITVGSIDKYDIPSGFNNISPSDSGLTTGAGLSLDIFAPGEDVIVADTTDIDSYAFASGTSLSAPMVAGVACEIASLNENAILEPNLKNIVLNTSTQDALLFEDERFSDNQNKLIHFIAGDEASTYKKNNTLSYLGVHQDNEPITADLKSAINATEFEGVFPEKPFTYSIELHEDSLDYDSFISCDASTGEINVEPPVNSVFDEGQKLKMVKFVGKASSDQATLETGTIFFFDINPDYLTETEEIESAITQSLSEVDSVSFFFDYTQLK